MNGHANESHEERGHTQRRVRNGDKSERWWIGEDVKRGKEERNRGRSPISL